MIMFNHFFPHFVSNKLNRKWPIVKIYSVSGRMWIKLFIRLQYSFLIFLCLSNKKRNDRPSYCRKIEGSNTVFYLFPYLLSSITNDCRVFPFLLDATQVYFPRLSSEVTATRRWLCMVVTLFQDMMTTPGLSSLNVLPSFSHLMDGNGSPLAAHVKCAISSSFVCSTLSVVV